MAKNASASKMAQVIPEDAQAANKTTSLKVSITYPYSSKDCLTYCMALIERLRTRDRDLRGGK